LPLEGTRTHPVTPPQCTQGVPLADRRRQCPPDQLPLLQPLMTLPLLLLPLWLGGHLSPPQLFGSRVPLLRLPAPLDAPLKGS
jgi:hypothetical protein